MHAPGIPIPEIDAYLEGVSAWQEELTELRRILLQCGLIETHKWMHPCYMWKETNVILLGGFKSNCVLSFIKGALLSDTEGILQKPGENSQSTRVIRFASLKQITDLDAVIRAYIFEAIEVEKAGLKVERIDNTELEFVAELQAKMDKDAVFGLAFESLTPGRQRTYNIYIAAAKQSATREARIEKYVPRILKGKGMNDCVCGLSRRMPNCDGSHKQLEGSR